MTKPDFSKKNLIRPKFGHLGLKWPKNEVFEFLKKIESKDLPGNGLK